MLGLAILAFSATAQANYPGQNGKISYAFGGSKMHVVNPDGSGDVAIPQSGFPQEGVWDHAWSPDGTQIAFTYLNENAEVGPDLYVMNADGSGAHLVTGTYSFGVSWSPDGRKLALGRSDDIYTVNADGTGLTNLTNSPNVQETSPTWSPDGTRIAFVMCSGITCDIYTMTPDGALTGRITTDPDREAAPDWSPDGQRIVFHRSSAGGGGNGDVWVANADATSETQLTAGETGGLPKWSPDGRKIVFGQLNASGIYTMNADGSGRTLVASAYAEYTGWQPVLHDRPQSASTLSASLVPAFRQTISATQCASRGGANSTHGAPLALASCNPPGYLPNTGARLGPKAVASVSMSVVPGNLATIADEADVAISISATDVRDRVSDDDYRTASHLHDLTLTPQFRVSDTFNGPSLNTDATTEDADFPIPVACFNTADVTIGASCNAGTSADAVLGGTVKEGRKMVLQSYRLWLRDAGADFIAGNADDRAFAQSGIYVP